MRGGAGWGLFEAPPAGPLVARGAGSEGARPPCTLISRVSVDPVFLILASPAIFDVVFFTTSPGSFGAPLWDPLEEGPREGHSMGGAERSSQSTRLKFSICASTSLCTAPQGDHVARLEGAGAWVRSAGHREIGRGGPPSGGHKEWRSESR